MNKNENKNKNICTERGRIDFPGESCFNSYYVVLKFTRVL